jgi:hypothetical protein
MDWMYSSTHRARPESLPPLDRPESSGQARAHFLGIAAQTMRRILLDHTKQRPAAWRRQFTVEVDKSLLGSRAVHLIARNEARSELNRIDDPLRSRMVEMRFFAGVANQESAVARESRTDTVQGQWTGARAWPYHAINNHGGTA